MDREDQDQIGNSASKEQPGVIHPPPNPPNLEGLDWGNKRSDNQVGSNLLARPPEKKEKTETHSGLNSLSDPQLAAARRITKHCRHRSQMELRCRICAPPTSTAKGGRTTQTKQASHGGEGCRCVREHAGKQREKQREELTLCFGTSKIGKEEQQFGTKGFNNQIQQYQT